MNEKNKQTTYSDEWKSKSLVVLGCSCVWPFMGAIVAVVIDILL